MKVLYFVHRFYVPIHPAHDTGINDRARQTVSHFCRAQKGLQDMWLRLFAARIRTKWVSLEWRQVLELGVMGSVAIVQSRVSDRIPRC
jgi:hypothetical protein